MQATTGKCFICGASLSKDEMKAHLLGCRGREQGDEPLFLIFVKDDYFPEIYWLALEIPRSATLADLDDYLRRIWVDCCGHYSWFTIGEADYGRRPNPSPVELVLDEYAHVKTMDVPLEDVLTVGETVQYSYDEVWPSVLRVTPLAAYSGNVPDGGVRLLARNYKPFKPCRVCGKPAEWLYTDSWPQEAYCDEHARQHPAWGKPNVFLPFVNSPRVGLCVYRGPKDESLLFEVYPPGQGGF